MNLQRGIGTQFIIMYLCNSYHGFILSIQRHYQIESPELNTLPGNYMVAVTYHRLIAPHNLQLDRWFIVMCVVCSIPSYTNPRASIGQRSASAHRMSLLLLAVFGNSPLATTTSLDISSCLGTMAPASKQKTYP